MSYHITIRYDNHVGMISSSSYPVIFLLDIALSSTTPSTTSSHRQHQRIPTHELISITNETTIPMNVPSMYVIGAFGVPSTIHQYNYKILIAGGIGRIM